ncbi:hypothetical protein K438DRAFT_2096302 [Mycena galopus ATCC 62051]|nr:hypothetical protein K438DRAFT_2096302 [Mycena galopus ATCC 62051]
MPMASFRVLTDWWGRSKSGGEESHTAALDDILADSLLKRPLHRTESDDPMKVGTSRKMNFLKPLVVIAGEHGRGGKRERWSTEAGIVDLIGIRSERGWKTRSKTVGYYRGWGNRSLLMQSRRTREQNMNFGNWLRPLAEEYNFEATNVSPQSPKGAALSLALTGCGPAKKQNWAYLVIANSSIVNGSSTSAVKPLGNSRYLVTSGKMTSHIVKRVRENLGRGDKRGWVMRRKISKSMLRPGELIWAFWPHSAAFQVRCSCHEDLLKRPSLRKGRCNGKWGWYRGTLLPLNRCGPKLCAPDTGDHFEEFDKTRIQWAAFQSKECSSWLLAPFCLFEPTAPSGIFLGKVIGGPWWLQRCDLNRTHRGASLQLRSRRPRRLRSRSPAKTIESGDDVTENPAGQSDGRETSTTFAKGEKTARRSPWRPGRVTSGEGSNRLVMSDGQVNGRANAKRPERKDMSAEDTHSPAVPKRLEETK